MVHAGVDAAASGYWMYRAVGSGVYYNVGETDHRGDADTLTPLLSVRTLVNHEWHYNSAGWS